MINKLRNWIVSILETLPPSEDRGVEFHDRIIYTEDEKISLSLELCAE